MMATNINDADDPTTGKVLKTASENGITHYRMAYYDYDRNGDLQLQLEKLRNKARHLAKLNEKYGIKGAYQNHEGTHVGASVWDIWYVLKEIDPDWIGLQFDIRHATVEGGKSWVNDLRLVHDHIHCSVIKDFIWELNSVNRWVVRNVPVGEGMVDFDQYFKLFKEFDIAGPISLHIEYPIFTQDEATLSLNQKLRVAEKVLSKDLKMARQLLGAAGISG
jgi:L-ribulose-5-phosphate 3-epimerase